MLREKESIQMAAIHKRRADINWFYDVLPEEIQEIIWKMVERSRRLPILMQFEKMPKLDYIDGKKERLIMNAQAFRPREQIANMGYAIQTSSTMVWTSQHANGEELMRLHYRTSSVSYFDYDFMGERKLRSEKKFETIKQTMYQKSPYDILHTWHGSTHFSSGKPIDGLDGCGYNSYRSINSLAITMSGWHCNNSADKLRECCKMNGLAIRGNKRELVRRLWGQE